MKIKVKISTRESFKILWRIGLCILKRIKSNSLCHDSLIVNLFMSDINNLNNLAALEFHIEYFPVRKLIFEDLFD